MPVQLSAPAMSSSLPLSREHASAILLAVMDVFRPARELAESPGVHTPTGLARAILTAAGHTAGPLRDAIAAVAALDQGYSPMVAAAQANVDAWFGAFEAVDDDTPLQGGNIFSPAMAWLNERIDGGLRDVIALASAVTPPIDS